MRFSKLFKISSTHLSTVFTHATRVGSMQGIKLLHAPDESDNRFIIALTKQVKGSVKRNKVRRRIKAALAQLLKQHPLPAGIWICVAYESAITLTVANIHHFLRATLCDQNKTL